MPDPRISDAIYRRYALFLGVLFSLFLFRVAAQLLQFLHPVDLLPPFESWQSGALPYGWLLFSQLLIVAVFSRILVHFAKRTLVGDRKVGKWLLSIGATYGTIMAFRLVAGLTFASEVHWFAVKLPTLFHLVLASFLLTLGHFHYRFGHDRVTNRISLREVATWCVYPMVTLFALLLYYQLPRYGVNPTVSSYMAAMVGGFGLITLFELILPYRREWLPTREEVRTDLIFIVLVQVLLPNLLSLLSVVWLQGFFAHHNWEIHIDWPHQSPVWIQMLLMMFTADFFRYWLHRSMHTWIPLWRFHAVHHSVQKLYWINVGRFHPIDKALQFVCDALPFIVLGVSRDVLMLYFVVYSIKGFFQHSNVDVKLGWLNYLISGPELHRWHHSKRVKESNTNYGNNVIVWDILFGTFFFPKNKEVGDLGLLNREYPTGFIQQMKAPFVQGLDKGT
jgi:sterol desaturase/sphingolipid hydroxylase (fatty acid hydroxylase superfamily)